MKKIYLLIIFINIFSFAYGSILKPKIKNINLKNPIEYVFKTDKITIIDAITKIANEHSKDENWTVSKENDDFILSIFVFESPYHIMQGKPTGRENSQFGEIQGEFKIHILQQENKILVKLKKVYYEICIGEKYVWLSPDPGYVAAFKSIPSSTYFEYSFLLKLGELLGEKGMPPINDNPDGIRTKFYEEQKRKKAEEESKRLEQKSRPVYYEEEKKESIEDGKFYNKKYQEYDFKE